MNYPKFFCKLNQIEYFWYNRKSWTWRYYKYIIERLKEDILKALSLVKYSTILGYYESYFKKMDLYRKKVIYRTGKWKKLTSHN